MKVYVVHKQDWRSYPILGVFASREEALSLMNEHGWHRDGDPATYCNVWEIGATDPEDYFRIEDQTYGGPIRRARIQITQKIGRGPANMHRTPIDCISYRGPGRKYANLGLTILSDEGHPPPAAPTYLACACADAIIVEGPQEAWDSYLTGAAPWRTTPEPEWLD